MPNAPQRREHVDGYTKSKPRFRPNNYYERPRDNLEPVEVPIRSPALARELIDMWKNCPEVSLAIETYSNDMFCSSDGDDRGFKIGEEFPDKTKTNPKVLDILKPFVTNVIGGRKLEKAAMRSLIYGDAFANIVFDADFTEITRILHLPTWELYRIEDDHGILLGFIQKRDYYHDETAIEFHPITVIHWRHKPQYLYGESIARSIVTDWADLKEFKWDHRLASRAVGTNAKVHRMPVGTDDDYRNDYIDFYQSQLADGPVTDYYMAGGGRDSSSAGEVVMLRERDPDLSSMINSEESRRRIIVARLGIPSYVAMLMGLSGGKDITGQPAMAYARQVNSHRGMLSEGIIQLCNTQLALHGIDPRLKENAYPIVFPKIYINQLAADSSKAQEEEENGRTVKSTPPPPQKNGLGHILAKASTRTPLN